MAAPNIGTFAEAPPLPDWLAGHFLQEEVPGALAQAILAVARATDYLLNRLRTEPVDALGGATPFLRAFGTMAGGHYLGLGALAASRRADDPHMAARLAIARFYAENILPEAGACSAAAVTGREMLYALEPEQMGG